MAEAAPLGDDAWKRWKPDAQQRAMALLREAENNHWHPFYCPNSACTGEPHCIPKDPTKKCTGRNGWHMWRLIEGKWVCREKECRMPGRLVDEWAFPHARPDQRPPKWTEEWLTLLLRSGRGSGKTRTGSEITNRVTKMVGRIILIAATGPDFRDTMVEGESGILATSPPGQRPLWEPSKKRLTWPNGCIAQGFSAEEPDRLRGPQCFVAGTLIQTDRGAVPIEQVTTEDSAWTRHGLRRVRAVNVGERVVMDSPLFTATPDHLIWTENRGWVEHQFIVPGDTIVTWCPTCTPRQAATSSSRLDRTPCTTPAGSGFRSTDHSLMDGTSTTSTLTAPTTGSRTSSPCHEPTTRNCTRLSGVHTAAWTAEETSSSSGAVLVGAAPSASATPTETLAAGPTSVVGAAASSYAESAEPSSRLAGGGSAPSGASTSGVQTVYDLTVDEHPEFFANGVLVHNSGFVWADEPAHWALVEECWENMLYGLRLGEHPKIVATSTPKPTKWMKGLVAKPDTIDRVVSTYANIGNLAPTYRRNVIEPREGTRMGRQELFGEILEDVEGALWTWEMIEYVKEAPRLIRIVVSVDPAGTNKKRSDETGIIVLGIGEDKRIYILADYTGKFSPSGWGTQVWKAVRDWQADAIAYEKNYGGEMVLHVLDTTKPHDLEARLIPVTSRRGKDIRAEPIVALYEKHLVKHVGERGDLGNLEDEQTSWVPGEGASPNRVDALVHGATELAKGVGGDASVASPIQIMQTRREGPGGAQRGPYL